MKKDILPFLYFQIMRKLAGAVQRHAPDHTVFGKRIEGIESGAEKIYSLLVRDEPCLIGRIGSTEMQTVNACLNVQMGLRQGIPQTVLDVVYCNAGFFPKSEKLIWRFFEEYTSAMGKTDIMALLGSGDEDYALKRYCTHADAISLRALEPYYADRPWTRALRGKRVLVVHPFVKSIEKQYQKRSLLFNHPDILPDFDLVTIRAVQTIADNTEGFDDWFQALDHMKKQISLAEFDIAIIGCGAYAFPLGAYVKDLGKKAVVLAGATQILFGIKGSRWDQHPVISQLYNENWVRPDETEKPKQFQRIEGGCYW